VALLFERVAIVGVGLIGGSLSLAAKAAGLIGHVTGVGRGAANLAVARERGIADRTTHDLADIGPVDLVVLGVPVNAVTTVARQLATHLRPGAVVTDVASVKGPVVEAVELLLPSSCPFVGCHPIAGTERSGSAAAEIDLFRGARCVVTPTLSTDESALERVEALWRGVGMTVQRMSPGEHDRALAWTSHLVHAIAYTLAGAIDSRDPDLFDFAGPSLRDATRVAATVPDLWREILLGNSETVAEVIGEFGVALDELRRALAARDEETLMRYLEAGHMGRRRLEEKKP
jgi:prephenate dehydrogenase